MQEPVPYERYPFGTIFIANLLTLSLYVIGAILLYQFLPLLVIPYILFILSLELRLLSGHCIDCYYYGKACAFGKGRLCATLYPRGSPERFCRMTVTWKDILPDFLVFIIPVLAGIILLVMAFRISTLVLVILLLILGFAGNAFVRGQLACRYCRQRTNGCPAAQLFDKKHT